MSNAVIDASRFAASKSPTAGIQEAIDALPPGGGTVYLPPGRYRLRRSVLVPSNVTIRGEGAATVLTRPAGIIRPLARPSDGARKSVHVRDVAGIRPGDQVCIRDEESRGWWSAHGIVGAVRGGELALQVLHGERKHRFLPARGACVTNWFCAFWLREAHNVTIRDLTIDGAAAKRGRRLCDFVVAAIHTRRSDNVRVLGVTVRRWPGDGIGLQGGRGGRVSGCIVEDCIGHGYHPGTGLTGSVWSDNFARGNTADGLFFCLRVTHATVRGNVLVGNGGHGIGGLTDPDMFNVVAGNVCAENGMHGIDGRRAVGNVISGNVCRGNSRTGRGQFAGIFLSGHRDCVVTANVCADDRPRPTQTRGLVCEDPAGPNVIADNLG